MLIASIRRTEMNKEGILSWLERWTLPIVSIAFLVLYYASFYWQGYVSAPGGDLYNHVSLMRDLQSHGFSVFFVGYPRLFHLVLLIATTITGLNPLRVMLYMLPLVMLGVALSAGWVARLIAGRTAGIVTTVLLLFISQQPWQTLYDGGFPSVIAAGIFLPLWVGSTGLYLQRGGRTWGLASLLFILLIVCTHHLTTIYLFLMVAFLVPFYISRLNRGWALGLAAALIVLWFTPLTEPLHHLLATVLVPQSVFPWYHLVGHLDNPDAIWPISDYPHAISYLVVYGGLLGLLSLSLLAMWRHESKVIPFMVAVWAIFLLVGSQVKALDFPVRLARDASIPLAIGAGVGIVQIWRLASKRWFTLAAFILLLIWAGGPELSRRAYSVFFIYEPTMQYTGADQAAVDQVGSAPTLSLDRPLPSVVKSTIVFSSPDSTLMDAALTSWFRTTLAPFQYVIYEVPMGDQSSDLRYRPSLEGVGFTEVAAYGDPLKTVMVFQKQSDADTLK